MGDRWFKVLAALTLCMAATANVLVFRFAFDNEPLPSMLVEVPDTGPVPAPVFDAPATDSGEPFLHTRSSKHFVLSTNIPLDLEELLQHAEKARSATFEELGIDAQAWPKKLPLVLCRSAGELNEAGKVIGAKLPPGPRAAGGYYPQGPAIAVVDTADRRALTVSHEVVHAVIGPLFRRCPPVLHEGIAMAVSERLLREDPSLEEYWKRHDGWRASWLRRARDADSIPALSSFMRYTYWWFHNRNERLNYYLAWCLAEALMQCPDGGQLYDLLTECNRRWDQWNALMSIHRDNDIETRWREQIARLAEVK